LLGWADWRGRRHIPLDQLGWRHALLIGLAQALALIPGTSRSGITMTAALMLGYKRSAAARFSFLLSIPVIVAAGSLMGLELLEVPQTFDWGTLIMGIGVSFISSWCCIHWFLHTIERLGMWPFVLYRLVLGIILLWLIVFL
jgi:undecaprenyl-diphosphatase